MTPLSPLPENRAKTALFAREGSLWFPQPACVGPWGKEWLHGGPVAALCTAIAEELVPDADRVTSRLTLELIKPVPLAPLEVQGEILRSGRRLSLVDVEIRAAGAVVAFARLQRTSQMPIELPELEGTGVELRGPADRPEDFVPMLQTGSPVDRAPFVRDATVIRTPRETGIYEPHPTEAWICVFADLLPGVPMSTTAAAMAAADYGNALGAPEAPGTNTYFPNADLSVHLARPPVSAWIRMAPQTTWLVEGIGHTRCELADQRGMLGTSAVTLVMGNLRPNR